MTWQAYGSFVLFAAVLMLIPGPDFAVVFKNALTGGRWRGAWAGIGVAAAAGGQGCAAAFGLGALVVASQPLFTTVKWAGAAYLLYLGVQALRSAWRSRYTALAAAPVAATPRDALAGFRQGFLSNITNPKVIAFYLAVLPQFLPTNSTVAQALPLALTHAAMSAAYLVAVAFGVHRLGDLLRQRRVRRTLDAATGTLLVGFSARLALESP